MAVCIVLMHKPGESPLFEKVKSSSSTKFTSKSSSTRCMPTVMTVSVRLHISDDHYLDNLHLFNQRQVYVDHGIPVALYVSAHGCGQLPLGVLQLVLGGQEVAAKLGAPTNPTTPCCNQSCFIADRKSVV